MPYLHCPSCRLVTYSVARHSSVDECPRCGESLSAQPRPMFGVIPLAPERRDEVVDETPAAR